MDSDDKPITIEGKENPYGLPNVLGYINKVHPLENRIIGNYLNGQSTVQLVNSLIGHPYQLIQNEYEIDYNKLLDNKQFAGK
jgi:hypothetical protein